MFFCIDGLVLISFSYIHFILLLIDKVSFNIILVIINFKSLNVLGSR
jgi:hypothetical protein